METQATRPEVWQWSEYYCPWSYLAAVRLHAIMPEYRGRVRLRIRPFPLEILDNDPAPRDVLEQEWWLAAIQEPAAAFAPYRGDDWPGTTLPAFEAAWCAARQGDDALLDYDLRVRRAFFAEGRDIGRREELVAIAEEAGLDLTRFARDSGGGARAVVRAEARLGRERYGVRGTPTLMLADGTRLRHPVAYPRMEDRRVVGVATLPCGGAGCLDATRALVERALRHGSEIPGAGNPQAAGSGVPHRAPWPVGRSKER
jgi:predicted DsbA family dithiol-disulfide isomerase